MAASTIEPRRRSFGRPRRRLDVVLLGDDAAAMATRKRRSEGLAAEVVMWRIFAERLIVAETVRPDL
jgi:hypothetical protein